MAATDDDKYNAVVVSLPFQNSLDCMYGPGGPWTLEIAGITLLEMLLTNIQNSKLGIVYFLTHSLWSEALKSYVTAMCSNQHCEIEMSFVELESGISNLGDALRYMQSNFVLQKNFILLTRPATFQFTFDLHVERFKKLTPAVVLKSFNFPAPDLSLKCLTVKKNDRIVKMASGTECINFDLTALQTHHRLQLCQQYQLGSLFICRPNILTYFEDNFDIVSMDTLVNWVTTNEEILSMQMCFEKLDTFFSAPANPDDFYALVHDVYESWLDLPSNIKCKKMTSVDTHYENGLYGSFGSTFVADSAEIGADCSLMSSFVGESASVGSNSTLINCIVSQGSSVGSDCSLRNVLIPAGKSIQNGVTSECEAGDIFSVLPVSQLDEEHTHNISSRLDSLQITENSDLDRLKVDQQHQQQQMVDVADEQDTVQQHRFVNEVIIALEHLIEHNNLKQAHVDIQLIRNDFNFDPATFNRLVITSLCRCFTTTFQLYKELQDPREALMDTIDKFQCLFECYISGYVGEMNALDTIASFSSQDETFLYTLPTFIYEIYDRELLSEEAILSWFDSLDDDDYPAVQKSICKFVEFLKSE